MNSNEIYFVCIVLLLKKQNNKDVIIHQILFVMLQPLCVLFQRGYLEHEWQLARNIDHWV